MTEHEALARERIRSLGSRDWFLQQLVRLTNESSVSTGFPVTLCVKGLIVSGVLASGREYFAELAETVAATVANVDEATRKDLHEYFAAFGELYPRHGDNADEGGGSEPENVLKTLPEFIHLRDVRIFDGTRSMRPATQNGIWWRGRIAEIDGFVLGTLDRSTA